MGWSLSALNAIVVSPVRKFQLEIKKEDVWFSGYFYQTDMYIFDILIVIISTGCPKKRTSYIGDKPQTGPIYWPD